MVRRSVLWQVDKETFRKIVKQNKTHTEVLKHFGLEGKGGNYTTLKRRIEHDKISTKHFKPQHNLPTKTAISLKKVLTKNSSYSRYTLKKRLIKKGLIPNKCVLCGLQNKWQNKPINMVLDHINGVSDDHRLKNLRLVCPNCNSQLPTHAGKNKFKNQNHCVECSKVITKHAQRCIQCASKKRRLPRPSKEQLLKELSNSNYCAVGRKYGVSDNAIRRWIKT